MRIRWLNALREQCGRPLRIRAETIRTGIRPPHCIQYMDPSVYGMYTVYTVYTYTAYIRKAAALVMYEDALSSPPQPQSYCQLISSPPSPSPR